MKNKTIEDSIHGDLREKTKTNPILKAIFFLVVVYLIWDIFSQQQMIEEKKQSLSVVDRLIEEEQQRKKSLERERDMLNSDEALEKMAREKLGMVKPGERVFVDLNRQ